MVGVSDMKRAIAAAILATSLFAVSCGGSDDEATSEEVNLTVDAAADGSVDLSNVESQLSEVLEEVKDRTNRSD